jgi:Zn-dependent protease
MSRQRRWVWLAVFVAGGGVLSPPFWSGAARSAVFLLAVTALMVVRELARLIAGRALGLRAAIVEIGEGPAVARFRTGAIRWVVGSTPLGGETIWEPPPPELPVRGRLALLALVRPAVAGGTLLILRAAGVPLGLGSDGGIVGGQVAMAAEILLLFGLIPFTISGQSVVPFESDGMKVVKLLFGRGSDPRHDFGRTYFAMAREALNDGDPARAAALCREGAARQGPPWSDALRAYEATAMARGGDPRAAMARAESELARDLPPVSRAVALNDWSWYAFLVRDEAAMRLADRRSADALVLKPELAAVAGTRGAILMWQGRPAEALPLLERGCTGAHSPQARDTNLCLLAMATAAQGDVARAQGLLREVRQGERAEGLLPEAERAVRAAAQPEVRVEAIRGSRSVIFAPDGVEVRGANGAGRRVTSSEIRRVEIGRTARGRAQILIRTDRGGWRLPIAPADLTWARMLFGRVAARVAAPEPTVAAAEQADSLETQERAYQERAAASSGTVSSSRGVLLLGSVIGFAASMLFLSSSWRWVGTLIPILFVHELGHWVAMRAFGHRDARIAFIPLMGAATMTRKPFRKRWQEIVMLLAGPVPGIIAGTVLLVIPATRHMRQVQWFAAAALGLNVMNLLPLHPLDGGRILHALVTAGRPRLDLAFKTVAGLAFAVAGAAWHEPALLILGVFSLLFWPQARRLSTLERRIRSTPGFDTRLAPEARRAYIFRALAHEPALKGKDWASTVATLEAPLGYQPTPGWQIGLGVLALVAFVMGGSVLGSRWMSRRSASWRCPEPTQATVLSCDAGPSTVAWTPDSSGSVGAFVWCDPPGGEELDDEVVDRIGELEVASHYCGALPWTDAKSWGDEKSARARRTVWRLAKLYDVAHAPGTEGLEKAIARAERDPDLDREIMPLLRERPNAGDDRRLAIEAEIGRRVGKMAGSCDGSRVFNVDSTEDGARFGLFLQDPAVLAPVSRYLCRLGCRVSVLPAAPDDRRLRVCF